MCVEGCENIFHIALTKFAWYSAFSYLIWKLSHIFCVTSTLQLKVILGETKHLMQPICSAAE